MANKVRFKWKMSGFKALREDPALAPILNEKARAMAAAAGDGYEAKSAETTGGRGRLRAAVIAASYAAQRDNAKNHTLTRVIRGGA